MRPTVQWGPSHQTSKRPRVNYGWRVGVWILVALRAVFTASEVAQHQSEGKIAAGIGWLALLVLIGLPASLHARLIRPVGRRLKWLGQIRSPRRDTSHDPLAAVRDGAQAAGGGVYLGRTDTGSARFSRPERSVLLLGPPRSGKTSAVIIPAVLSHTGPVVSTSTKPDVAKATRLIRALGGRVWTFDPTGSNFPSQLELRWSPVTSSRSWGGALLMARAMCSRAASGTSDQTHWSSRAQALLAPMLHAAAVHGKDIEAVVDWVMRHEIDQAGVLLEDRRCSRLAFGSLLGIFNTEDRERSSIFSAAADALQAYTSEDALATTRDPNFDAGAFVRSSDTIYIDAPAEQQAAAAPIVCGLLSEIRRATYNAHANQQLTAGRVLFALDELANIAPLEELPQIASEGGGQGLLLLAAVQDLSQARQRWGAQADGFLTLFGAKLILPGIADTRTLETISQTLGEYDRQVVSQTRPQGRGLFTAVLGGPPTPPDSTTYSTQRSRVLSPGEIANIPNGRALHLDGVRWELVTLTPAHQAEPWRTLTAIPF
jgi:type IV secretion system protein VirD4